MTTTTSTDINSMTFQSSTQFNDENNRSFLLNQSISSMDIDTNDLIVGPPTNTTTNVHPHFSPLHPIENGLNVDETEKKPILHRLGNPILNKSFDVLPQVKDRDTSSTSSDHQVLDTTVELPKNETHVLKTTTPNNVAAPFLQPQFSVEYPYEIAQLPTPTSTTNSIETMENLTKKLNINKTVDRQGSLTPVLPSEKSVDANTFILKKKERRKLPTPMTTNEQSFNSTMEETPPDSCNKQSPFNTPSVSLDTNMITRSVTVTPALHPSIDPSKIIDCVEQYYRILYRVCECTEELKQEVRQVKNERDQMSEDLIKAENAYADVKKRNEKLKLIINEHKTNTETLKRFSEESVRYTEEQKQKYAVLKQHAQEKLNEANGEIERLRRVQSSEVEGIQAQLRYAQLRVQSLEQELKSVKQELEQKKKENIELTNICDELLATNKR